MNNLANLLKGRGARLRLRMRTEVSGFLGCVVPFVLHRDDGGRRGDSPWWLCLDLGLMLSGDLSPRSRQHEHANLLQPCAGRYAEAEQLFRETLAARKETFGDRHPDTLSSMNNLGTLLAATGAPQRTPDRSAHPPHLNRESVPAAMAECVATRSGRYTSNTPARVKRLRCQPSPV